MWHVQCAVLVGGRDGQNDCDHHKRRRDLGKNQGAVSSRHSPILACDTHGGHWKLCSHTLSFRVLELAQQIRGLKTKSAISLCFTSCRTGNQHGVHSSELACRCSNILDGVDVFTEERHMPLHQMAHILRLRTSVYPASA